jgi:hypothetical protein
VVDTGAVVEQVGAQVSDGEDRERFTHIVLEGFHLDDQQFVPTGNSVVDGMVNATPVVALCGKTWVPGRDASRYPVCATCAEIARSLGWRVPGS